ncbi:MAG: hypothetical protein HAW65_03070 [Alphaproteobacteria bacterium]|nr:hypothetical protein [Alphaproteobacteria bacterium]
MPAQKQPSHILAQNFAINCQSKPSDVQHISVVRLTLGLVSNIYNAEAAYILGASRGRKKLSTSRHVLHYLAHICFGVNYTALAAYTNRDRTSIAHACERVEDMRDNPQMDKALYFAEYALVSMAQHINPLLAAQDEQDKRIGL